MNETGNGTGGISVLIPTYNPDINDIKEILTILNNQTYRKFEIIIANDGADFLNQIQSVMPINSVPFQYRKNDKRLGLYGSIKENVTYCKYENILVLEQDIIPLSINYLKSLIELLESGPKIVVTSSLIIDVKTDYKKYVFYRRRISNLRTIDSSKITSEFSSNSPIDAEVTFTKADLLSKDILTELFSMGSKNTNTAQDIILSSIIQRNRKLVTSDATACEIGHSDPTSFTFFLKKEYLYGKSVFDVWRHSDKNALTSTKYFKEKLFRLLFVATEIIAIIFCLFEFLVNGPLRLPLLIAIIGIGLFYTQAVLARINFWAFGRRSQFLFTKIIKASVYIIMLDVTYALGILRRLI